MAFLFPNYEPNSADIMVSTWGHLVWRGLRDAKRTWGKGAHPRIWRQTWVSLLFGVLLLQVRNCLQPDLFSLRQPGFPFPCYGKVALWNTEGQSWGAAGYPEHLLVFSRSFVRTRRLTEWCRMQCSVHDLLTFDFLPTSPCKGEGRFYEEF